ncbi:MAG: VOC family protein [Solirubrobacteraceae bacterium]|nr:VOC family protein [Solirubrobacteraceae bacterium]
MVHHVGLEVKLGDLDACVAFWTLLGWREVAVPDGIGDRGRWLQRGAQQVHLLVVDTPVAPREGHVALVDPELDQTVERLQASGHEVLERTRYWGARRIFTRSPGGHRVELMSAAPAAGS